MHLTKAEREHYQHHGYLVRESVFSATELEQLRAATEIACQTCLQSAAQGEEYILDGKRFVDVERRTLQFEYDDATLLRVVEPVHDTHQTLDALVDDPRIVLPMHALVGSASLALWTSKFNLKPPRVGSGFGWHQDSPYWMHECDHLDQLPNVMLTLDDSDQENGCFRVISGSHHEGVLPGTADGSVLGGFYTDPARVDLDRAVDFEVPAGSLIFFSPHVIHGSGPNETSRQRRALIYTYQPAGHSLLKYGVARTVAGVS